MNPFDLFNRFLKRSERFGNKKRSKRNPLSKSERRKVHKRERQNKKRARNK